VEHPFRPDRGGRALASGNRIYAANPDLPHKAMEFYRDYLGFGVDFEHRFGDNFPLYCQVSRGACVLHLSEHAGDASPGAKAFTWMRDIRDFHRELTAKDYRYLKPGLEDAPWGLQMTVTDPFSNRIAFCEKV
jgi:uncharacterized glyoxalase superfamily protein PhnB